MTPEIPAGIPQRFFYQISQDSHLFFFENSTNFLGIYKEITSRITSDTGICLRNVSILSIKTSSRNLSMDISKE